MDRRGVFKGYLRYVYNLRPVLEKMEDRGIPINDTRRREFGTELDLAAAETDKEMQLLVPDELKNVHPKEGYKRIPKDTTGMIRKYFALTQKEQEFLDYVGNNDKHVPVHEERWCRLEPFKPSSQQLIRYMRHRGHPVPINLKKGKETSEAKELERLAKKTHDPLYRKVIWYR